jgi:hypothetical protein
MKNNKPMKTDKDKIDEIYRNIKYIKGNLFVITLILAAIFGYVLSELVN